MKLSKTNQHTGLKFEFTKSLAGNMRVFIDLGGNSITSLGTKKQADKMIKYLDEVKRLIVSNRSKLQ